VSSRAKGNGSTSDTVGTREKSAKSHVVQGKPTSNDANTEVHRVCRYLPSVIFLASPPTSPATLVIFSRFSFGKNGGGAGRREKITRRQQTCLIVEQGHKLLKGPIVRSNRVWFGHTFKKFYIDRQTRVFYFFGIPSVSTITMSYNWTWSTRSIFLAGKKRIFFYDPPLLT
jgi:hypothetical protein